MAIVADYFYEPIPPAVLTDPLAYWLSMCGFAMAVLVSLEWTHRLVWVMVEKKEPLRSPKTVYRVMMLGIFISTILRNTPDLVLFMSWKEVTPYTRQVISHWNRVFDGISAPPYIFAWFIGMLATVVMDHQLGREPLPVELYPKLRSLIRPAIMVVCTMAICFAIAFLE